MSAVAHSGPKKTLYVTGSRPPAKRSTPERLQDAAKSLWQRALIVFAGPAINFLFAILILAGFAFAYGKSVTPPVVAGVMPSSAAAEAGLLPGDKIAVHVEGKIDMCERVNGTYPIGHLDQGGIDYERLREIIGRYRDQVMTHCHRCPASKFCSVCFSHVEGEGDFARIASACAGTITQARGRLADYTSVMERNRDADFIVDTDVSYLEQRMLYGY